jgi:hypothetical protein
MKGNIRARPLRFLAYILMGFFLASTVWDGAWASSPAAMRKVNRQIRTSTLRAPRRVNKFTRHKVRHFKARRRALPAPQRSPKLKTPGPVSIASSTVKALPPRIRRRLKNGRLTPPSIPGGRARFPKGSILTETPQFHKGLAGPFLQPKSSNVMSRRLRFKAPQKLALDSRPKTLARSTRKGLPHRLRRKNRLKAQATPSTRKITPKPALNAVTPTRPKAVRESKRSFLPDPHQVHSKKSLGFHEPKIKMTRKRHHNPSTRHNVYSSHKDSHRHHRHVHIHHHHWHFWRPWYYHHWHFWRPWVYWWGPWHPHVIHLYPVPFYVNLVLYPVYTSVLVYRETPVVETGWVIFQVEPDEVEVYLDGLYLGTSWELEKRAVKVEAGTHMVRLVLDWYEVEYELYVEANTTSYFVRELAGLNIRGISISFWNPVPVSP